MFSKSYKPWLTLFVAIIFITSVINVMTEEPPKPRSMPGINAPDQFKNGCVSCHKNYPEMKYDGRLSTILTAWSEATEPKILAKVQAIDPTITLKGKHSFKPNSETSIPEACNKCHGKMKNAFPLFQIVHAIHLSNDKDNHYLNMYQGECTHCHKLDPVKGTWSIINGKEAE